MSVSFTVVSQSLDLALLYVLGKKQTIRAAYVKFVETINDYVTQNITNVRVNVHVRKLCVLWMYQQKGKIKMCLISCQKI